MSAERSATTSMIIRKTIAIIKKFEELLGA